MSHAPARESLFRQWHVALWYFLPFGLGWALGLAALVLNKPAARRDPVFLTGYVVFSLLLFVGAWWSNRRAVRKRLDSRIEELEKLRRHLTAPASA